MKYRIKYGMIPCMQLNGLYRPEMTYEVQERFLWIFWETILFTDNKEQAESYLQSLRECELENIKRKFVSLD